MPGSVKRINQSRVRRGLKMIKDSVVSGQQKLKERTFSLGTEMVRKGIRNLKP